MYFDMMKTNSLTGPPQNARNLLVLLLICLVNVTGAEKQGIKKHEVLSWEAPLSNDDFNNWKLAESSIALKDKIVLSPTGKDQFGFMQCMWTFEATAWEMSIDFEIDYESERAEFAKGEWQLYLIKNVPQSISRKQYRDFGEGLATD